MQTADLLQKILSRHSLSQAAIAELLGVDRVQVTRYVAGERDPAPLGCLILSALTDIEAEKRHWIAASKLDSNQLELLRKALNTTPTDTLSGQEKKLLEWFRKPVNAMEKSLKDLVEQLLKVRTQ